jgi:hypothetical protein
MSYLSEEDDVKTLGPSSLLARRDKRALESRSSFSMPASMSAAEWEIFSSHSSSRNSPHNTGSVCSFPLFANALQDPFRLSACSPLSVVGFQVLPFESVPNEGKAVEKSMIRRIGCYFAPPDCDKIS